MSRALLLAVLALAASACSAGPPRGSDPVQDRLAPCPAAPHCVNSQAGPADTRHAIAPLSPVADAAAWERVAAAVAASERTTIAERGERYLRAEVVSPWHVYTDDLELLWLPEQQRVEVRSSSRIGYYDFGVNRDRVEALRARLLEQGVLKP